MSTITDVKDLAWYGTGRLGLPTLHHVASIDKFNITVLVRRDPASYSGLPSDVQVKQIDFAERSTLVNALVGHDAVVVFTSMAPHNDMDIIELELINATPVIAAKREVHNYLLARSSEGKIDFATLHAGNMLTSVGMFASIHVAKRIAILPDGGDHPISISSKETLGKGLVGLLSKYPENKNTHLYICNGETTMKQIVLAVQKASGSEEAWNISSYSLEENKKKADGNLRNGSISLTDFVGVLAVP
ncbi:hypothetical protein KVT40_009044 [Elsinoe batatas]|uniref:NAD(P)-binding domain-containing protein n=1 Tax=Elsinoe batatas TaxID=2601811 RepID=A0A8K0L1F4_9PEZI|nr:hypothetical protein KVT40_009044 [Elsinoe batatas]